MAKNDVHVEAVRRRQLRKAKRQAPETVQLGDNGATTTSGTAAGATPATKKKPVAATKGASAAAATTAPPAAAAPSAPGIRRLSKPAVAAATAASGNNNSSNEQQKQQAAPADMAGNVSFRRTTTDKRQTNVQKLLVVGSRSMNQKERHLLNDLTNIMAHGRPHPKLEARNDVGTQIQDLCALHNCNGSVYLESRKGDTGYLWFAQAPEGPSMKMQLFNVHTADELRMVGNCLKYSRPLLHFDAEFETVPHLRIARALLTSTFNIPRYHARSKPFVDHILCFFVLEGKIYFRHYQILEGAAASAASSAAATSIVTSGSATGGGSSGRFGLTEIGPRFVLDPQVLLKGCVRGQVVWKSETAIAPTVQRRNRKERALEKSRANERIQEAGERHRQALPAPGPDPLEGIFNRNPEMK